MGWKSTIDITREEALRIVANFLADPPEEINDEDLADMVESARGGENHGHNYRIIDKVDDDD